jgi:hypothetical protein
MNPLLRLVIPKLDDRRPRKDLGTERSASMMGSEIPVTVFFLTVTVIVGMTLLGSLAYLAFRAFVVCGTTTIVYTAGVVAIVWQLNSTLSEKQHYG